MLILCVLTHKLCIWVGRCLKIWKIDEVIEKATETSEAGADFFYLVAKI